ncbi:sulfotransferase family protein [Streptomyces phytophilus]|uniref:sulfotransferase family protein n=1 Tax=Streptomyces phytophilus TaxID=722715 RepID=UPI0015F0D810|nr:sulfotransferase family protein [Streptomyces phytophilus]
MLEVIGAGVGRTGTLSLKTALERLGFGPCHHMLGLFEDPGQIPMWQAASRGEAVDWRQVFAEYRSTVDWPGARFWREISGAFPEAKVVLTVRDPESWYASAASSIHAAAVAPPPEDADEGFLRLREMSLEVVWDGVFDGRFTDKEHALKVVAEHDAAVREGVDAGRLLVFRVSEGWEPLCEFLGVPVPDEAFPRSNERGRFMDEVRERNAAGSAAGDGSSRDGSSGDGSSGDGGSGDGGGEDAAG